MSTKTLFYKTNEIEINEYSLENEYIKFKVIDFGATITELQTKDCFGQFENIIASFENPKDYLEQPGPYLNAIVAPVAGRIAYGKYMLDGEEQQLSINNGANHLHGGETGVSKQIFDVKEEENKLIMTLVSDHTVDGFVDGDFSYQVIYTLEENNLKIDYLGIPPKKSILNMTTHLYFNLSGDMKTSIESQMLCIPTQTKLKIHEDGHPFVEESIVEGSAFDFNTPTLLGERIQQGDPEFRLTKALDTPFVLERGTIELSDPVSKRKMVMKSDAPSVVVYTANYFDDALILNKGQKGYELCAIALETEDVPNGVNIYKDQEYNLYSPNKPYKQTTVYTFTIVE